MEPKDGPEMLDQIWKQLTTTLNSCGDGPIRQQTEWKKVFTEWKSATRRKCREKKELNECERKLIELTGPAAVDGHSNIAEIGVEFQEPGGSAQIADEEHISDNEENIILTVVDDNDENVVQEPTGIKRKRDRKTTGDILTDAYKQSTNAQKEGLDNISEALRDIAKAIHRFCDIAESQKEN
ncbi:hypothetical protein MTP99_003795 [Tenebrio molitor]|nr:hypothetical protein MTP99_003795 [Tenebrio molitor]